MTTSDHQVTNGHHQVTTSDHHMIISDTLDHLHREYYEILFISSEVWHAPATNLHGSKTEDIVCWHAAGAGLVWGWITLFLFDCNNVQECSLRMHYAVGRFSENTQL